MKDKKPVDLEEAIERLKSIHDENVKQRILNMSEEEFVVGAHFSTGMWIRNNWGLWGKRGLAAFFNSIGIFHPDDMSGIILTSYHRELCGKDWNVTEQVQFYQDFWRQAEEHDHKMRTDTIYRKKMLARNDSLLIARFEQKKSEWPQGKKIVGHIEYQCGLIDLGKRTAISGTIKEWKNEDLLIQVDNYVDERKKKRIAKCYNMKNDILLIPNHSLIHFKLDE